LGRGRQVEEVKYARIVQAKEREIEKIKKGGLNG